MGVLHAAVKRGSLADVEKLLEKIDSTGTPDINGFDNQGRTPLHHAAEMGHVRIAAALIDAGAEPVRRARADREGPAALHFAAQNGHAAMVKLLIFSLSGFDRSSHAGAYSEDYTIDSVASMLDPAGDYFQIEMTPLLLACSAGHPAAAMQLIVAGADMEARCGQSRFSVLHLACRHETPAMLPVVNAALERGLKDAKSSNGIVALATAACYGAADAIRAILAAGATANDLNSVEFAAVHGDVAAVKAFLWFATANRMKMPRLEPSLEAVDQEIRRCLRLGAMWGGGDQRSQQLRRYGRVVAALVAAGAGPWAKVPMPCPGLEAALPAVQERAPEELPRLFERLDPATQDRIRHVLLVLHRLFPAPGDFFQRRAVLTHVLADADD